jgi:hypothetical protein
MNVTTEYLPIRGLNIPRYREKLNELRISINIPNREVSVVPVADVRLTIRYMIPAKLIATPPAFCHVIGSFNTTAAIIIVYMGDIADNTEQSIGVICGIPTRNVT